MKKIILGICTIGILFSSNIYAKNIVLKKGYLPLCERKSNALPSAEMLAFAIYTGDTNKMQQAQNKLQENGCIILAVGQQKEAIVKILKEEQVKAGKEWTTLKKIKFVSLNGHKINDEFWIADILNDIK